MSTVRTILAVAILGVAVYGVSIWLHQNGPSTLPNVMLSDGSAPSGLQPGSPGLPPPVELGSPQPLALSAGPQGTTPPPLPYPAEAAIQPYASSAPLAGGLAPSMAVGSQGMTPIPAEPSVMPVTPKPDCPEFDQALLAVQPLLQTGRLAEALQQLTQWYGDTRLSQRQTADLLRLLDPLAATVIYAYEYPLDAHYIVQPGDTLDQIAARHNVEWQTLAKINGLADPRQLQPGHQLKVIPGPFHALVDLSDHELTLIVGGYYAGRFPVGIGQDFPQQESQYTVREKSMPPASAQNGYWIGLDLPLGLHVAPDPNQVGRTGGAGFLSLREADMAEIFDLLSVGSQVFVRP